MAQVLHGCVTTTEAGRRAIQNSQERPRALAKRYGINQKTVAKWERRTSVADLLIGPKVPHSSALSLEEETTITAFARSVVGHDPALHDVRYLVPAGEMVRARRPPRRARRRRQMRIVCACRECADRGASNAADAESSIAPRPSRPCSVPWQETRLSFRLQEARFPTRADTACGRDPYLVAAIRRVSAGALRPGDGSSWSIRWPPFHGEIPNAHP